MKDERSIVLTSLEKIENELIASGKLLSSNAVFLKKDTLPMENIKNALVEVLKAQKYLKQN